MKEITEAFKFLDQHSGCLNRGQLDLLKGLLRYYRKHKQLSEKQASILCDMRKYAIEYQDETIQCNDRSVNETVN